VHLDMYQSARALQISLIRAAHSLDKQDTNLRVSQPVAASLVSSLALAYSETRTTPIASTSGGERMCDHKSDLRYRSALQSVIKKVGRRLGRLAHAYVRHGLRFCVASLPSIHLIDPYLFGRC
jgi:hypothetical protein